ncbi:hypothetical protein BHE74_00023008 [Ensete ventricosum]|nr:hypothetical protein BHE74_00023008 [Ensete ventricosum]
MTSFGVVISVRDLFGSHIVTHALLLEAKNRIQRVVYTIKSSQETPPTTSETSRRFSSRNLCWIPARAVGHLCIFSDRIDLIDSIRYRLRCANGDLRGRDERLPAVTFVFLAPQNMLRMVEKQASRSRSCGLKPADGGGGGDGDAMAVREGRANRLDMEEKEEEEQ